MLKYSDFPLKTIKKEIFLFSFLGNVTVLWAQKIIGFVVSSHRNFRITSLFLISVTLNNISF